MNRSGYLLAAALWVLASPCLAQANPAADKLAELEARIDQMARRIEVIEAQLAGGVEPASGPGVRTTKDLVWQFDTYLSDAPFAVSQQELDRKTGRVDLLLNLVAEPPDADLWRQIQVGGAVPIEVTATLAGGEAMAPIVFDLHRRTDLAPGTFVHVLGQLPADDAKAARRLVIRHTGQP